MKTKLVPPVALFVLVLLVAGAAALNACSGDDCDCGTQLQECYAECPPQGSPGHATCIQACSHQYSCCALLCCGGCSPYCGGRCPNSSNGARSSWVFKPPSTLADEWGLLIALRGGNEAGSFINLSTGHGSDAAGQVCTPHPRSQ